MVGKKFLASLFLLFILITSILVGCADSKGALKSDKKIIKIGISQIVEHPALDSSRKGFLDALKSKGYEDGKNIEIDFQNAQGDIPTTQTIAQNFVADKKDIIFAIATPTAQAAFNTTKEIPILITAVTDPVSSGLVKSLEKSGTNVTGTTDMTPVEKQFNLLKKLIPNAKKVGIIYNTSEANSEIQVKLAKNISSKYGLQVVDVGITNVNEVSQGIDSLLDKVDVLYTPTDNLVASSMPLIVDKCTKKSIPIISGEKAHVESGSLATDGIDYYKLGFQTGIMAVDIINGKSPKDMPVEALKDTKLTINTNTAQKLNIQISEDLKKSADLIKGGE